MNEPVSHDAQPVNDEGGPTQDSVVAGMMLRQARESAGVHIAALAVALKVPVHKLEALEAGYFDVFPDVVFVRALASSMCRTLKVDPAPVLALLPQNRPPALSAHRGINASFKPGSGQSASSSGASGSRMAVAAVVVLLVAAAALLLWPHRPTGMAGDESASIKGTSVETSGGSEKVADEPTAGASPTLSPSASITSVPSASMSGASSAAAGAAPVTNAAATAVPGSAASSPIGDSTNAALVIRTRGESWVQVRGAAGSTVLQRVLAAGETVTVPGTPPWSVVIGKADVTEVTVHGKPLELKTVSRENVARFEVKP